MGEPEKTYGTLRELMADQERIVREIDPSETLYAKRKRECEAEEKAIAERTAAEQAIPATVAYSDPLWTRLVALEARVAADEDDLKKLTECLTQAAGQVIGTKARNVRDYADAGDRKLSDRFDQTNHELRAELGRMQGRIDSLTDALMRVTLRDPAAEKRTTGEDKGGEVVDLVPSLRTVYTVPEDGAA